MKKILGFLICLTISVSAFAVDSWSKSEPAGTQNLSDIDTLITTNNTSLDRLLSNYKRGAKIEYVSSSTLTVTAGELTVSNASGSDRELLQNTSDTTVQWTDLDTGAEDVSTTYYVYAYGSTSNETFSIIVSESATAPSGQNQFRLLGTFYNDADGNITLIKNIQVQAATYDSGWFAVSTASTYSKTHNLGTTSFNVNVYYSASSNGTDARIVRQAMHDESPQYSGGCIVDDITNYSFAIKTGHQSIDSNMAHPSNDIWYWGGSRLYSTRITSGYYKVVAVAIN